MIKCCIFKFIINITKSKNDNSIKTYKNKTWFIQLFKIIVIEKEIMLCCLYSWCLLWKFICIFQRVTTIISYQNQLLNLESKIESCLCFCCGRRGSYCCGREWNCWGRGGSFRLFPLPNKRLKALKKIISGRKNRSNKRFPVSNWRWGSTDCGPGRLNKLNNWFPFGNGLLKVPDWGRGFPSLLEIRIAAIKATTSNRIWMFF